MTNLILEKVLACPYCLFSLNFESSTARCPNCSRTFENKDGIWRLLKLQKGTILAQGEYDRSHNQKFARLNDGSYEFFASLAQGNKTIDIACGDGYIEKLSPETIAVNFSLNALKKAKNNGAKYLVLADAHSLPFKDNSFDIAISTGNLEHFINPAKAIAEMARISQIQVVTFHKKIPVLFADLIFDLATKILSIKHQPIEKPLNPNIIEGMFKKAGLHIIFKGDWTLPINYGRPVKFLPALENMPSCSFVISIKK